MLPVPREAIAAVGGEEDFVELLRRERADCLEYGAGRSPRPCGASETAAFIGRGLRGGLQQGHTRILLAKTVAVCRGRLTKEVTDQRFISPDDFDLDEYMRDSFGVIHTDVEKVVIKFDPSLERYLKENIWHPSQVFKKDKDGNVILTMEVGGLVEVMSWVLGFGRQAEILEPDHLRLAVSEEVKAVAERYEKEGGGFTFGRSETRGGLEE